MTWISISADDVKTRLTGVELSALRQAALAPDQPDPLPDIVSHVIDEVRGYIAANPKNTLGEAGTIPPKLLSAALAIIRYRLATRLPIKTLLTEDRVKENDAAIRLLERVADDKFAIEDPLTGDTPGIAIQLVTKPARLATRQTLAGL